MHTSADGGEEQLMQRRTSNRLLAEFSVPSQPGNERIAMERVADAVLQTAALAEPRLQRLKTAVSETVLNAMEHGSHYQADQPVTIRVSASESLVSVSVTDFGGGTRDRSAVTPDIDAKLAGIQSPRGWGLFLIQHMVDEVSDEVDGRMHTVELRVRLDADSSA
jgi:anti-sigma regulatory factor (Ser/Thr protein kinase)